MPTEATSFILRFRDLGITETISRHEAIAKTDAHVWWGWWSKTGERAPIRVLHEITQAGPVTVLLLDSGQGCLYRATCHKVDARPVRFSSPDKAKTPDYYRDQEYFAWYQLSDFARVPSEDAEATLHELTYVQLDDFFDDEASPFKTFYGKRIHSISELIQQNRTVWFTRQSTTNDPQHAIALYNAHQERPQHFASTYWPTPSTTLLWVSDLHFASGGTHHAFPDAPGDQQANLWLALERALKVHSVEKLAGVVVSGDITWRADPDEFDKASDFLVRLMSTYKLEPRQLLVIPGNHDIAFSSTPAEKRAEVTRAAPDSEAAYRTFYQRLFAITPNDYLSCGKRLLLGGALPVDIVGLNSSLLQQHPDFHTDPTSSSPVFQGQGYLGVAQLDDAVQKLGWDERSYSVLRPLRIAVLHHHVVPVTEHERAVAGGNYGMVLDAERLSRWLVRHRVDVVLHGHQHQPFSVAMTRTEVLDEKHAEHHTFRILGMGSTGVSLTDLGAVKTNTFGLLEFGTNGVAVNYNSVHPTDRSKTVLTLNIPYAPNGRGV